RLAQTAAGDLPAAADRRRCGPPGDGEVAPCRPEIPAAAEAVEVTPAQAAAIRGCGGDAGKLGPRSHRARADQPPVGEREGAPSPAVPVADAGPSGIERADACGLDPGQAEAPGEVGRGE